jgi:hypothetical protein
VEFLVEIQVTLFPELPDTVREELMERERARGLGLKARGSAGASGGSPDGRQTSESGMHRTQRRSTTP